MSEQNEPKAKRNLDTANAKRIEKAKLDQERIAKNMKILMAQGEKLREIIKARDVSITDLAKELCVQRQTIYNWMDGKTAIPEDMVLELSAKFKVQPVEIRYNVQSFNENDLELVLCIAEEYFDSNNINYIPKEVKASIMAKCYTLYMSEIGNVIHPEAIKLLIIDEIIKFFEFYKKFGGELGDKSKKK
jgi:plasmid maintenance system antidote protein VapI